MSMPSSLSREIDHRESDGIKVRLLWREHNDTAVVAVCDSRTGDAFAIDVRDGEHAIDVFHHPYAYADAHRTPLTAA